MWGTYGAIPAPSASSGHLEDKYPVRVSADGEGERTETVYSDERGWYSRPAVKAGDE